MRHILSNLWGHRVYTIDLLGKKEIPYIVEH